MKPPGRLLRGTVLVVMTLIFGTTWAAIRIGLEGIPPFTGVAMRFVVASTLLVLLARAMRLSFDVGPLGWRVWWAHALLSFCISYSVTYWAEQWVPSGLISVLFATFPLFVALLAHFWLPGERLTLGGTIGILAGFAGVTVIFSEDLSMLGGPMVATASAVMLLSPLAAAVSNVIIKRWGGGIHPVTLNAGAMAITTGIIGGFALAFERERELHLTPVVVGSVLYLAIFGSAVGFVLYFWMLHHTDASRLALIALVVPIIAVAIGRVLFDEPFTVRTLVGSAMVLVGVGVASTARRL